MPVLEVNSVLAAVAFGDAPGDAAIGLPAATDATDSWLRAVALSGVGHYSAARSELRRTRRTTTDPALLSLTHSTEGSLLRQLGWHAHAAVADGRAAALVLPPSPAPGSAPASTPAEILRAEAVCDALTGLAADALGTLRPALAARLLHRCRTHLDFHLRDVESAWRPRIRLHWVSAETALSAPGANLISAPADSSSAGSDSSSAATARVPAAVNRVPAQPDSGRNHPEVVLLQDDPAPLQEDPALAHAEAALVLAESSPSLRHRVKSRLLLAAASAAAGDLDRSRSLATEVAAQCRALELLPLRWACAMLRSGIDPAGDGAAEAAECARLLAMRGGRLRSPGDLLARP
ncbi:hypothetical protein ACIP5Y_43800 [Nocardia sp. NPDC088792]|uniref:hypothetical protein n=1 Tax=Nocardia sp. NPDC088792 TaxID=3364332 RepID=UPI003819D933